jgi:hypothetical protein
MFINYNKNPAGNFTGDCVIRGIATVMDREWDDVWLEIMTVAFKEKDMMTSNRIWQKYLEQQGYHRYMLPETCPDCYTIKDFTRDFDVGRFIVGTGTHVIAVIDGNYYDTGDSGDDIPIYYWKKG